MSYTVRPRDARFLGPEKNRVAQISCNLSYLIGGGQDIQHQYIGVHVNARKNLKHVRKKRSA